GFFTVSVGGLASGNYSWRVKGPGEGSSNTTPGYLANSSALSGTLTLAGDAVTRFDMGYMRTGDANNDNVVNISDYNLYLAGFGQTCGGGSYDARVDFNFDCVINTTDFSLMHSNWGASGAPALRPGKR